MSESQVQFENVSKRFGRSWAVQGVDLEIERGEFVALMGPSGCGKTTTLRMLAGLEVPSSGTISLSGQVMNHLAPHERDTPMVWQSLALFPFLDVQQNVEFGLKMRGVDAENRSRRALEWIERLGLGDFADRDVTRLSGGQRQRVALARALVTEPEILLLDEPLSALDAHLVVRMQGELKRLQAELGITFVYVTHSQSEAFAMADRIVIMNEGSVAQVGPSRDIYRFPANRFVAEFVGRNNLIVGELGGDEGGGTRLSSTIGEFHASLAPTSTQAQGIFVIGADRVEISAEEPPEDVNINRVPCTFISEQFVGSFVTLFFEATDGTELKVELQQRQLDTLQLQHGDNLWLHWSAGDVHVLPDVSKQN